MTHLMGHIGTPGRRDVACSMGVHRASERNARRAPRWATGGRAAQKGWEPILVTPTHLKDLRNYHLAQLWRKAEQALRQAKKITFIGYSMPGDDMHIKYLFKRALRTRKDAPPKIVVVDWIDPAERRRLKRKKEKPAVQLAYERFFGAKGVRFYDIGFEAWANRYLRFRADRDLAEMGDSEVNAFLKQLATSGVSRSTQSQALSGLRFLYQEVLHTRLGEHEAIGCPRRRREVPAIVSLAEFQRIAERAEEIDRLIFQLLFGAGLRLVEAVNLRVRITGDTHPSFRFVANDRDSKSSSAAEALLTRIGLPTPSRPSRYSPGGSSAGSRPTV